MTKKKIEFYINMFFIFLFVISIASTVIIHNKFDIDAIVCLLMVWIFLGTIRLAIQGIMDAFSKSKNYNRLMKICISLTVIFMLALEIQLIFVPIVTSNLIELHYDLSEMKDNKLEIDNPAGEFIIFKINNGSNYRIYFPRRIKQINTLFTSYDKDGQHVGRTHWLEGPDFKVKDNYVESRHYLNANYNDGKGRHMIVYRYRLTPWEFLKDPTKILIDKFK